MAKKKSVPKSVSRKTMSQKSAARRRRFMVQLPEAYRAALQTLSKKSDRTITASVRRGVDRELRDNGIEPPGA